MVYVQRKWLCKCRTALNTYKCLFGQHGPIWTFLWRHRSYQTFNFFKIGPHPDIPLDVPDAKTTEGEAEQAKKRRGRKKSKLEDMFPAYLQEAFFGKTLLDQSKRAFLAPPVQRHTQGILRPPLHGARNPASEPG